MVDLIKAMKTAAATGIPVMTALKAQTTAPVVTTVAKTTTVAPVATTTTTAAKTTTTAATTPVATVAKAVATGVTAGLTASTTAAKAATPAATTVTSTTTGAVAATTPVSNTSKSNADTIAARYATQGYTAQVVAEAGGTYKVVLSPGTTTPAATTTVAPTVTTTKVTTPTVTTPVATTPITTVAKTTTTAAPITITPAVASTPLGKILTKLGSAVTPTVESKEVLDKAAEAPKVYTQAGAISWAKDQLAKEAAATTTTEPSSGRIGLTTVATPVVTTPAPAAPTETRKTISGETMGNRNFTVIQVKPVTGDVYYTVEEGGKTVSGFENVTDSGSIHWKLGKAVYGEKYGEPSVTTVENKDYLLTAPYFDTTKIPGSTVTDLSVGGKPVYVPSAVSKKISAATEKKTDLFVDTLPAAKTGTATPEQLGATVVIPGQKPTEAQAAFIEKVTVFEKKEEPHRTEMTLEKEHYVGKSETGEPLYVKESPAQVLHEYNPAKQDTGQQQLYSQLESDVTGSLTIVAGNINVATEAQKNIPLAQDYIKQINTSITDINKAGANDSIFLIEGGVEVKYTKTEALDKLNAALKTNQDYLDWAKTTSEKIPEYKTAQQSLSNQQFMVSKYKQLGYKVSDTAEGYAFELPSSTEVYQWKHGEMTGAALSSAAFLESPLAVKTIGSAIQSAITGDKKVGEARIEELSTYALGLDVALKEGDYAMHVLASPAMVEGVYLPLTMLGATSLISEGISVAAPRITAGLETIGSKFTPEGQAILTSVKQTATKVSEPFISAGKVAAKVTGTELGSQTLNWSMYGALEGGHIVEVAATHPEELGSTIAESAFSWGLTTAAMGEGFKGLSEKMPKGKFIEQDIAQTKLEAELGFKPDVAAIPQKVESTSIYFQYPGAEKGTVEFTGVGEAVAKAPKQKPVEFEITVSGTGKELPDVIKINEVPRSLTVTDAKASITWTEKGKFGEKIEHTRFETITGYSEPAAKAGDESIIASAAKSEHGLDVVAIEEPVIIKKIGTFDTGKATVTGYGMKGETGTIDVMKSTVSDIKERGVIFVVGAKEEEKTIEKIGEKGVGDISVVRSLEGDTQAGIHVKLVTKDTGMKPLDFGKVSVGAGEEVRAGEGMAARLASEEAKPVVKPLDFGKVSSQIGKAISEELSKMAIEPISTTGITTAASGLAYGTGLRLTEAAAKTTTVAKAKTTATESKLEWKDTGRLTTITVPYELQTPSEKSRIEEILFTGGRSVTGGKTGEELEPDVVTGIITELTPETGQGTDQGIGTITDVTPDIAQDTGQDMEQRLEQIQEQELKMDVFNILTTVTTPTVTPPPSIPGITPFRRRKKDEEVEEQLFGKKKKKKVAAPEGHAEKMIMADIVSVMRSQARFGKATHPKMSKKVYEAAARTGFRHIPTLEMKTKQYTPRVKSNGLRLDSNKLMVGNLKMKVNIKRGKRNAPRKKKWI
jgi:hypothetical protein